MSQSCDREAGFDGELGFPGFDDMLEPGEIPIGPACTFLLFRVFIS